MAENTAEAQHVGWGRLAFVFLQKGTEQWNKSGLSVGGEPCATFSPWMPSRTNIGELVQVAFYIFTILGMACAGVIPSKPCHGKRKTTIIVSSIGHPCAYLWGKRQKEGLQQDLRWQDGGGRSGESASPESLLPPRPWRATANLR